MIRRVALSIFLAFTLVVPATSALAADGGIELNRLGWYVQADGFWAFENYNATMQRITGGNVSSLDGVGFNVRAGYQFLSWLAVDGMYEYATSLDSNIAGAPRALTLSTHSLGGNLKLSLPYYWMQPYVTLGVYGQRQNFRALVPNPWVRSHQEWNFAGRPGLGIDFVVTEHWTVNVEAAGMLALTNYRAEGGGKLDSLFYTSFGAGVRYRF